MALNTYNVRHSSMHPVCPTCRSKLVYTGRDDTTLVTRMAFKCGAVLTIDISDEWKPETQCPHFFKPFGHKDEINPPPRCPFCGSFNAGGGQHSARYDCGSHIWIERTPDKPMIQGSLVMKGHEGECTKINKERNDKK